MYVLLLFFYGQKHVKELEAARKVAEWFHVKHYEFDLSSILQYSRIVPSWLAPARKSSMKAMKTR